MRNVHEPPATPGSRPARPFSDDATRAAYAYDASAHRVRPSSIAFPRDAEELAALVADSARAGVPVTARGGGTSMAGNAIGPGMVADLSRHMNRILEIDAARRIARVEAGAVLDALNGALRPLGLEFGPDPSSHSRCTIGGMFGNDACGNRSLRTGRTGESVLAVEGVLGTGERVTVTRDAVVVHGPDGAPRGRAIADGLAALARAHLADIRRSRTGMPRQVSGYHLEWLLPESTDLVRSLAGSEGTCLVVTELTVRLRPSSPASALVVLGFESIVDAARVAPILAPASPSAIEGLDHRLVDRLRELRGPAAAAGLPRGSAWLYVELQGESAEELAARIDDCLALARSTGLMVDDRVIESAELQRSLWRIREEGSGLASRTPDGRPTWPGWEDAAVAPIDLADYLERFLDLMGEFGLHGVLYGHFGAGCVHVRLDWDLGSTEGREARERFLERAARLVAEFRGSISGEHGDGRARSEYLGIMYPPPMLDAFSRFKRLWDPDGVLNPGVIVDPERGSTTIPVEPSGRRRERSIDTADLDGVGRCIGIGACRGHAAGFMCPSYRATGDELDSTRGRARVLQELAAGRLPDSVRSEAVTRALDLCLACKACSTDCPTGVDMATYKSEVLAARYARRPRPRSHYLLGRLPTWLRLARLPGAVRLVNLLLGRRCVARVAATVGGVEPRRPIPRLSPPARRPAQTSGASVVLLADTFTTAFRPEIVAATERLLRDTGATVTGCGADVCCGLTLITTGQRTRAIRTLHRTLRVLSDPGLAGLPVVVPEPSCAAALRQDLPRLVPTPDAAELAARVHTVGSYLRTHAPYWRPDVPVPRIGVQVHCHERAVFGAGEVERHLARMGVEVVESSADCCGLAGDFGFERGHLDVSLRVAALSLIPMVERLGDRATLVADGFSCAVQASQTTGTPGVHIAELLTGTSAAGTRGRDLGRLEDP